MNNIYFLCLLALALFSACGITNYTVEEPQKTYPYNEHITMSVKSITRTSGIGTGYGSISPKRGYKFFQFNMEFKNISTADHPVHFDSIFLADPKKKVFYKADFILMPGIITVFSKDEKKIKPGDTKTRVLAFTAPTEFSPTNLLVNNQLHTLNIIRK